MQCDIDWFVWTRPVRSRCCPRHWSEKVPKTNCEENCQSCVRRVVGVKVQTMRSWIRTGAKMKVDLLDCVNKFNNLMIRSWRSGESQICGSHWRTIPLAKSSLAHIIGSASPSTLRTSTGGWRRSGTGGLPPPCSWSTWTAAGNWRSLSKGPLP